jgi:hypothetical protein
MFGNIAFINRLASEREDNPLPKTLLGLSRHKIITVCTSEMWKEVIRQKQFSSNNNLSIPGLGSFYVDMSKLKKYIYSSVRRLRKLRARIEELSKNPNFDKENSMQVLKEKDLVIKVKASWSQLENIRKMIIIRTIKWNCKQRDNGNPQNIKVYYKAEEYAFIEEYIKTGKIK